MPTIITWEMVMPETAYTDEMLWLDWYKRQYERGLNRIEELEKSRLRDDEFLLAHVLYHEYGVKVAAEFLGITQKETQQKFDYVLNRRFRPVK